MDNRIFDKKNGLWYEKQGDYYIPCPSFFMHGKLHKVGLPFCKEKILPQNIDLLVYLMYAVKNRPTGRYLEEL